MAALALCEQGGGISEGEHLLVWLERTGTSSLQAVMLHEPAGVEQVGAAHEVLRPAVICRSLGDHMHQDQSVTTSSAPAARV